MGTIGELSEGAEAVEATTMAVVMPVAGSRPRRQGTRPLEEQVRREPPP